MKRRSYLDLFFTFFKIGLFTFGGGYAMIALIENICIYKKAWITEDEMAELTVLAESTPGPIAINAATYVGHLRSGFLGALAATVGVVLPSLAVILAVSLFLDGLMEIKAVQSAFAGIRIAVGVIIISAAVNMFSKMKKTPLAIIIFTLSFAALLAINAFSLRFSTLFMMLIAGAVGLIVFALSKRKGGKK